jgi:hypothetical protein
MLGITGKAGTPIYLLSKPQLPVAVSMALEVDLTDEKRLQGSKRPDLRLTTARKHCFQAIFTY